VIIIKIRISIYISISINSKENNLKLLHTDTGQATDIIQSNLKLAMSCVFGKQLKPPGL